MSYVEIHYFYMQTHKILHIHMCMYTKRYLSKSLFTYAHGLPKFIVMLGKKSMISSPKEAILNPVPWICLLPLSVEYNVAFF